MLAREVMVIKVLQRGIVRAADIDDRNTRVRQLLFRWVAAHNGAAILRNQHATREQVIFVRATWVRHDSG